MKTKKQIIRDLIDILLIMDDNVDEAKSMLNYLIKELHDSTLVIAI